MRLVALSFLLFVSGIAVGAGPAVSPAEFDALVEKLFKLTERVEKLEATTRAIAAATAPSRDQVIAAAIIERRLAVGMSVADANNSLGVIGEVKSDSGEVKTYEWVVRGQPTYTPPRTSSVSSSGRFVSGDGYRPEPARQESKEPQPKRGRYSAEVKNGRIVSFTNP
jgi:hypothetical protein